MNITPDQAQEWIDGATAGPWGRTRMGALIDADGNTLVTDPDANMSDGDADLAAAAPDLAQTIAGMRWEWRREVRAVGEEDWKPLFWESSCRDAETSQAYWWTPENVVYEYRLVRRLVGPVEEAE